VYNTPNVEKKFFLFSGLRKKLWHGFFIAGNGPSRIPLGLLSHVLKFKSSNKKQPNKQNNQITNQTTLSFFSLFHTSKLQKKTHRL